MTHPNDRQERFSLIELMIVVAVLGIFAMLAGPCMVEFIDKRRLASQAKTISELLQQARSEAIKHSSDATPKTVTATVSPTGSWFVGLSNTGTTACDNGATPCTINQAGVDVTRLVTATECPGCTITSPTAVATIIYDLRGVVTDGAGGEGAARTITPLSTRGKQLQISVSTIGRITLWTPSASVPGYPSC
ncbi:MAG: GspH/FimT family pseudopilin [Rhodocyclaceae bacterium]|jgi:prepilin-type N-terminal cleavage/methylation domain-containing protein|nr:GspH/FimT family pseudopilin [Rhodocyclaceae bacterium]